MSLTTSDFTYLALDPDVLGRFGCLLHLDEVSTLIRDGLDITLVSESVPSLASSIVKALAPGLQCKTDDVPKLYQVVGHPLSGKSTLVEACCRLGIMAIDIDWILKRAYELAAYRFPNGESVRLAGGRLVRFSRRSKHITSSTIKRAWRSDDSELKGYAHVVAYATYALVYKAAYLLASKQQTPLFVVAQHVPFSLLTPCLHTTEGLRATSHYTDAELGARQSEVVYLFPTAEDLMERLALALEQVVGPTSKEQSSVPHRAYAALRGWLGLKARFASGDLEGSLVYHTSYELIRDLLDFSISRKEIHGSNT